MGPWVEHHSSDFSCGIQAMVFMYVVITKITTPHDTAYVANWCDAHKVIKSIPQQFMFEVDARNGSSTTYTQLMNRHPTIDMDAI